MSAARRSARSPRRADDGCSSRRAKRAGNAARADVRPVARAGAGAVRAGGRAHAPTLRRPRRSRRARAPATSYALPLDSLVAVAESAGLQWVNSDAAKIEAAQAAMAATAEPIRVPREIPPVAAVDDGPLVLVETKKDLSQVKLPFETTPRETQGL